MVKNQLRYRGCAFVTIFYMKGRGDFRMQAAKSAKAAQSLAGVAGFEPANAGTKNRCLTTWRHPSSHAALAGGRAAL